MNEENSSQLIKSGNPLVDLTWGGFYKGGTYFVIGPPKSGKTILALQFALNASSKADSCLYLTTSKLNHLMISSSLIDLELQNYIDQGIITLSRHAGPKFFKHTIDGDSNIRDNFTDFKKLIEIYRPARVVVDEFTSLIGYKNLKLISELFIDIQEYLQKRGVTGLYLIGEREGLECCEVQSSISKLSNACICLSKNSDSVDRSNPGIMKIIPNIGHAERKYSSKYYIEIHSGVKIISK